MVVPTFCFHFFRVPFDIPSPLPMHLWWFTVLNTMCSFSVNQTSTVQGVSVLHLEIATMRLATVVLVFGPVK